MSIHLLDVRKLKRRLPRHHCPSCQYDLLGQPIEGACPECGSAYGYLCRGCGNMLQDQGIRDECNQCGFVFDKSDGRSVRWGAEQHGQSPLKIFAVFIAEFLTILTRVAVGGTLVVGVVYLLFLALGIWAFPFCIYMGVVIAVAPGARRRF